MSRRHITFECEGSRLVGSIDEAPGQNGLLIVSGGNELRCGPWASQSQIAARLATQGFPVFRFDRRGIGDSEGPNVGFRASAPDIAAAIAAFRAACPHLARVVAYGNCDAASALMLNGGQGLDALVLANPWTFEDGDAAEPEAAPAAAVRSHYWRKLTNPAALVRLFTGKVALGGLLSGLRRAAAPNAPASRLARDMAERLAEYPGDVRFLLASRDRTALAFLAHWDRRDPRLHHCKDASHSFVEPAARQWLIDQLTAALSA